MNRIDPRSDDLTNAVVTLSCSLTSSRVDDRGVQVSGEILYEFDRDLNESASLSRKLLLIDFLIDGLIRDHPGINRQEILGAMMFIDKHLK